MVLKYPFVSGGFGSVVNYCNMGLCNMDLGMRVNNSSHNS